MIFSLTMYSSLTSISMMCLVVWVLWKALRKFILGSPFSNIPGPPRSSFLKGEIGKIFGNDAREYLQGLLKQYGPVVNIHFPFGESTLIVSDPKAMHHIFVKDQYIYEETDAFIANGLTIFGPGLLGTLGEQHRKQRKLMNPVFSIAHLRGMVPTFYEVVYQLRDVIASKVKEGPKEIEILTWTSRAALELIGQSGFGHSFNELCENATPHPFVQSFKEFTSLTQTGSAIFVRRYLVPLFYKFGLQVAINLVDNLQRTSAEIVESRKRALTFDEGNVGTEGQRGTGKDIMSILLRANMQAEKDDKLSDEEVVAQISTFTTAATNTTSSALARILWQLAHRQDAQDKLRLEIREARQDQADLDYDSLVNLPYLDAVCRETLRLYPPLGMVSRSCRKDMVLPLGTPIRGLDGKEMTEVFIPKGTNVLVSITASNCNPDIWGPDSYEWKPERWLESMPDSVTSARIPGVYSNLMTFIGGSRACIGFKFSQLEMKVVLLLLIESFKFSLSKKEICWETQTIALPKVVGSSFSQLPMVVERAA